MVANACTLTPKAGAFFALAISVQNFALVKSSLVLGAGDAKTLYAGVELHAELPKNLKNEYIYINNKLGFKP